MSEFKAKMYESFCYFRVSGLGTNLIRFFQLGSWAKKPGEYWGVVSLFSVITRVPAFSWFSLGLHSKAMWWPETKLPLLSSNLILYVTLPSLTVQKKMFQWKKKIFETIFTGHVRLCNILDESNVNTFIVSIFMFFNSILRHKFLLPFVTVFRTLPFCQPVARLLANTFMPAQILPVCLLYAYFLALTHDSSCLIMEITKKMTFTRLIWGKFCLKQCHQSYMPLLSHIPMN